MDYLFERRQSVLGGIAARLDRSRGVALFLRMTSEIGGERRDAFTAQNLAVSKTVRGGLAPRGFESLPPLSEAVLPDLHGYARPA